MQGKVLFVVGHLFSTLGEQGVVPEKSDRAIYDRMGKLGFQVFVASRATLDTLANTEFPELREELTQRLLLGIEFIVFSSTVVAGDEEPLTAQIGELFGDRLLPVVVMNQYLLEPLKMAERHGMVGLIGEARQVKIVETEKEQVCGLVGKQTISSEQLHYAVPNLPKSALKIATVDDDEDLAIYYVYRAGAEMPGGKRAPARRIALFFDAAVTAQATDAGWSIFDSAIELAAKAGNFNDVFRAEWAEVKERRAIHQIPTPDGEHPPDHLVGLALSGGGLRSATFSLGLLQGMREKNLLPIFDYLSTVSGGGYMGGWWSAWLARESSQGVFPQNEKIEAERVSDYLKSKDKLYEGSQYAGIDPIHHLRLFSNYLTPRKGLLSQDTWQAITVMIRNIVLTWVVLMPILFAFVVAGQFYFILQRNSVDELLFPFQARIVKANNKLEQITRTYDEKIQEADNELNVKGEQKESRLAAIKAEKDERLKKVNATIAGLQGTFSQVIGRRALLSAFLLVPIVLWLIMTTVYWMRIGVNPPAIAQLANSVPGIIFWIILICVICLNTSYSWEDWRIPYQLVRNGFAKTPVFWKFFFSLLWLAGAVWLWLKSLPYKKPEGALPETIFGKGKAVWLGFIDRLKKVWQVNTIGNFLNGLMILVMTGIIAAFLFGLRETVRRGVDGKYFWIAVVAIAVSIALWYYCHPQNEDKWEWRKIIHGNSVMRVQSSLMFILVMITLVLALSGYGYEIANYLLRDPQSHKTFLDYIAKAGGWAVVIMSIAGSIFTAVKSSPTGGEDKPDVSGAGFKTNLMFALTPILVLVSLAVAFAWLARWLLIQFHEAPDLFIVKMNKGIVVSVALYMFLAVYEIRNWEKFWSLIWRLLLLAGAAAFLYFGITTLWMPMADNFWAWKMYCLAISVVGMVTGWRIGFRLFGDAKRRILSILFIFSVYFVFFFLAAFKGEHSPEQFSSAAGSDSSLQVSVEQSAAMLSGIVCCAILMTYEWFKWDGKTSRTVRLTAFIHLVLTCFLFFAFFTNKEDHMSITMGYLALGLLFIAFSWSVAIGWMTDPNLLSLHMFYKSRLVRAYLGASNPNRNNLEISEAAGGDDVLLKDLQNCQKGAPYHLINTTLNLVGGRDLATAQRHSDYFVFSKLFSGASRTGYRRNLPEQYMQGQMTLGTAVAVSGAAVSPNMGAKTQTAAVAMLLTLLNVRLGYWASTPNRNLWRSAQASLWPFYMLKEFSSQTNDLSGYCYLTDGGHFDNTGLYSLIERACRFIILSDNGADTKPCFEDLGDAIRRCRIDFQAEIYLDMSPFFKKKDEISEDPLAQAHYVVGSIEYSEEHVKHIGWKTEDAENPDKRRGVLILVKPSLIKEDSIDLRQYARQNADFPQQSTSDLWYNEAQFESYRQIGKLCAEKVLDELGFTQAFAGGNPLTLDRIEKAFKGHYKPVEKKRVAFFE
jgi:hypothetical protein